MISNPLGEIRTNPLELKEKEIKFIVKLRQIKPTYVVTKPRRLCKQNEFSFGLVITYWSCIIILMHKFLFNHIFLIRQHFTNKNLKFTSKSGSPVKFV